MKICNVGARKALIHQFVLDKGMDGNGRVLDMNALQKTDARLKTRLQDLYGIARPIVDYQNTTEDQVSFVKETFHEVDALHGIYYSDNKKYHTDYTNDATLTPLQLANKYVVPANTELGVGFAQNINFTAEEVSKFKIGLELTYPNLQAKAVESRVINGEQRYKIVLTNKQSTTNDVVGDNIPGGIDEIRDYTEQIVIENTIAPLLSKFKGVTVEWVTEEGMKQILESNPKKLIADDVNVNAVVIKNKVYLTIGKVNVNTALEELMHLFVDKLITERKALFIGLRNQALEQYPALAIQIDSTYTNERGFNQNYRDVELVTRALRNAYVDIQTKKPSETDNSFFRVVKQFFKWLSEMFNNTFGLDIQDINDLPLNATLGDLASFIDENNVIFTDSEAIEPRYNLTSKTEDYDEDKDAEYKAEIEGKTIKEKKLENNANEIALLKRVLKKIQKDPAKSKIVPIVETLLANARAFRTLLENDVETVSTTKFVGNPLHDEKISKMSEKYAKFGTFIHNFMNELLITAIDTNLSPLQLLINNESFFTEFYERNKDMLMIPGLTEKGKVTEKIREKLLLDHLINIVGIVNDPFTKGDIVIPEITVFEYDSMGRPVVGRLDYITIKRDGTVSVSDFKTTRSKFEMKNYSHAAIFKERYTTALQDGVHPAFERFSGRSKASIFLSQIGVYERLLKRLGIPVSDSKIINIIYSPNKLLLEEEGTWVYENMHVAEVYIDGDQGLSMDLDEFGNPTTELSPMYKQVLRALVSSIHVEGETTEKEAEEKAREKINYISSIPEATLKIITDNLKTNLDTQLKQLDDEINKLYREKADDTKIEEAKSRKRLLLEAKNWFDRKTLEDGTLKELPKELLLKGVYDKVRELISTLRISSEETKNNLPKEKAINILGERYYQLEDLKNFLLLFKTLLLNNSDATETTDVIVEINGAIDSALKGQGLYIELAGEQFKKILLSMPKKNVEEMLQQMKLVYEMEINKLQRIISGDTSVLENFTFYLGGKVRKIFGSKVKTKTISNDMKEEAKKKLDKINEAIRTDKYDRDFIDIYVENTFTNPESNFYIGSTIDANSSGLTGDDLVASLGNSELAISAMAYYATNASQEASIRFFERMNALKFDSFVRSYSEKLGGYDNLVDAISQKIQEEDFESGETREFMSFLFSYDPKVHHIQDQFDYNIKVLKSQIDEIKNSGLAEDVIKEKLKDKYAELKVLKKEYSVWLVNNVETKLIPELYLLETSLPEDIQDEIEMINREIETIKSRHGNEDWMLDESDLLDIKRHESRISLLKKQAILENPELELIFEKMHKYYDYHISENKFEYARRQMLKLYPEDSSQYKKWLDLHSDIVADPAWMERMQELEEEKRALFGGSDPVLTELYEKRSKLIARHKFKSRFSSRSIFNPLYMSDEDYKELTDIEDAIEDYYEKAEEVDLSKADKKELKRINKELESMRQTQNKPEYMRELNERIAEIVRLDKEIAEETDPVEKAKKQSQLNIKDVEFKKWYDRNNTSKYILGTIVKNGKVAAAPKKFNTMYMPTDPSLTMRVPNSNYRTRTYKPEAYNPNYNPSLQRKRYSSGNYALPKGHRYDEATGRFLVSSDAKWVNPKYREMMADKNLSEFYNRFVMDEYYNKQFGMSANKLGFFYPGVLQSAFDTIAKDGLQGAIREGREWVNDHILTSKSETDRATNEYGMSGKQRVRFSHNYRLDTSLGTKDGIAAILKWGLQYEVYQAMEEANLALSPMIDYIKARKSEVKNEVRERQLDKLIDILEFDRNKLVYGIRYVGNEKSRKIRKVLRQITSFISYSRLATDPIMQVGNLMSGNIQMFLSEQGEQYGMGTYKDWAFAKYHMYGRDGFMYHVISDWGNIDNVTLSTKILRYFNVTATSFTDRLDSVGRSKLRRAFNIGDISYVIQDSGEMEIGMTTLLKNLSAHKFYLYDTNTDGSLKLDASGAPILKRDSEGELMTISAYDALVDNGEMTPGIRSDVAMTKDDLESIRAKTQQEYLFYQGNYAAQNQTKFESGMIGTLAFFFRKYLVPFVENRFKGSFGMGDPKAWLAGKPRLGWWTAMANIFRDLGLGQTVLSLIPETLSERTGKLKTNEFYKIKAAQARREIMIGAIWTMAYMLLRSFVYDDDDKKAVDKLSWSQMQALRLMAKVSNESRSMLYVPLVGKGDEFIKNFSSFTSAFNEGSVIADMFENLIYYIGYEVFDSETAYDMGFYKKKTNRYPKGYPKLFANFIKLSGLENIQDLINPKAAVKTAYQKKK